MGKEEEVCEGGSAEEKTDVGARSVNGLSPTITCLPPKAHSQMSNIILRPRRYEQNVLGGAVRKDARSASEWGIWPRLYDWAASFGLQSCITRIIGSLVHEASSSMYISKSIYGSTFINKHPHIVHLACHS